MSWQARVYLLRQQGIAFVCCNCEKLQPNEAGDPVCTEGRRCVGPPSGGTFDHYRGPVVDFGRFCFVCGERPVKHLRVGSSVRLMGVCEEHRALTRHLVKQPETKAEILGGDPEPTPKTLSALLAQAEQKTDT